MKDCKVKAPVPVSIVKWNFLDLMNYMSKVYKEDFKTVIWDYLNSIEVIRNNDSYFSAFFLMVREDFTLMRGRGSPKVIKYLGALNAEFDIQEKDVVWISW